ncbi:MAG TPA: type IV toxin-antitoxin system AbiEi family antitoxin domain-containing protein [Solirubrobacteraceae bacterium]|nr:type IV toxin-antitoxin system AbiEi family antitoxin domain-containing protein [Solirubrobacteraceae bacterium]
MSDSIDARIAAIAATQQRNITRQQLLGLGLNRRAIDYRVRIGRLYVVHPGVYSVGGPPVTVFERAYAALLACGGAAVLSHSSAMTLWGFYRRWDFPFEVTTGRDRRPKGVTVHRSRTLTGHDRDKQLGIPVTSPARTVLDIAPRLGDDLPTAVDKALLTKYVTKNLLAEAVDLHPGHPGAKLVLPFRERDAAALERDIITVRTWDRHYGAPAREFARLERILVRRRAYFSRS